MKYSLALLAALALPAHAESFFHAEVGLGMALSRDMGDGTWYQTGVAKHSETLNTPAYMVGVTGDATDWLAWHADYVYFGQQSASCVCVPDSAYNAQTHKASEPGYIPFNGFGHIQGLTLTLEPYTTWHGYRFAMEGGGWLSWASWHETHIDPALPGQVNISHRTQFSLSWLVGASVSRGNLSVSYRYYRQPQQWNPYPALVTGTHMIMVRYRF
jgi:hypothetical protein